MHSCSTTGVNFLKVLFQLCLHFSRWTCGDPVNIGVNLRKRFTNPVAYLLIRHFRNKRGTGAEMHPAIDLIHDTRHLCTRSRTDGIKAMSRGFSGSKQEKKKLPTEEIAVDFVYSRQQEMKSFFHFKDDNVKLWVKVFIVTFLYAVATVDVLMANSNDVNLAKTRQVHFWVM